MKKVLFFALGAGSITAMSIGSSRAHNVSSGSCWDCGPHSFCSSKSGTSLTNCSRFYDGEAKDWLWTRTITCAAGTTCSNALCGGKAVTGGSSNSYTPKGGGGTGYAHFVSAPSYSCAP